MIERKQVTDTGDYVAGFLTVGVWAEIVPVILGLLGVFWFVLRFINWYRSNYMGRDPWKM